MTDHRPPSQDLTPVLRFGRFALHRVERLLLRDRQPVPLSAPRLALLQALVDAAGRTVSDAELRERLRDWPDATPGLLPHVAALNRALGDGGTHYIAQMPGRGFRFVGAIGAIGAEGALVRAQPGRRLVGRDETLAAVIAQLRARRLLTIVGVGGMGKTTVAMNALPALAADFPDGIVVLDLAALASADLLAGVLGGQVGVKPGVGESPAALRDRLRHQLDGRRLLVVLDNCETMTDAAALLCEALLGARELRVLATSREPLGVPGEALHRLPALAFPAPDSAPDVDEALRFGAVELFVERAQLGPALRSLDRAQFGRILELCRRLDGMPLALELAAAHVADLGLDALLAQLGDRLLHLDAADADSGRHRTLQATLDWSHALLDDHQRAVLRRLAVFRARFGLASALAVAVEGADSGCGDDGLDADRALTALVGLATQSLLSVEATESADGSRVTLDYRLLDSTRAYALARLTAAGELSATLRRHALDCRDRLTRAETGWDEFSTSLTWAAEHGHMVDDVRAALDWAVDDRGGDDPALAAEIAMASLPMAGRLALLTEFGGRIERVIAALEARGELTPQRQFRLCSAMGELLMLPAGPVQAAKAFARASEVTEGLDAPRDRQAALVGRWISTHQLGNYPALQKTAEAMLAHAYELGEPGEILYALRGMAWACVYRGDHEGADRYARLALDYPASAMPNSYYMQTTVDREVAMRVILARTQWIRGFADQAAASAAEAIEHSLRDKAHSLGVALAIGACPVALWRGDDREAREMVERTRAHAERHALNYEFDWVRQYGLALSRRPLVDTDDAVGQLTPPPAPDVDRATVVHQDMLATLDPGLLTDAAAERAQTGHCGWNAPEVLRAMALRQLASGDAHAVARAEALLERALSLARFQGALGWELRVATTLAAHWSAGPRRAGARALLGGVLGRFTEGFGTADLRRARRWMARLSG